MPCDRCGSILLLIDELWKCPKCNRLNIVNKDEALKISNYRIKLINNVFAGHFRKFQKDRLIAHIIWARENFSRSFFKEYQGLDLNKFLTLNLLIKRLMSQQNYKNEIEADQKLVNEIVDTFSRLVSLVNMHIQLANSFANMMHKPQLNFREVDLEQLMADFRIVPNERFKPLLRTCRSHDVLTVTQAKEKIENYKREFKSLMLSKAHEPKKSYTIGGFVKHFYPTIDQFYCSLLRNALFARTFDFANFGDNLLSPRRLMDLVNQFPMVEEAITVANIDDFLEKLQVYCSLPEERLKELFIFSENNQKPFPLFVRLENYIFVSHRTSYLIHILLMPIFHKEVFHKETEKRGIELEKKEVKSEFEKIGYKYYSDIKDKKKATLQIDGLAICDEVAYVVECKEWGIRPFYDHRKIHSQIERDLKGVVDGVKFSTMKGKLRTKKTVSLPEKIEFVKQNRNRWTLNPEIPIDGLIIIRDYPPISSYKGIKIISIDEIKTLAAHSS